MYGNSRDVVNHTFGEALPATNSRFEKKFSEKDFIHGQGMTVEGTIVELRHHTLKDPDMYHRYLAVVIEAKRGNNRTFDEKGNTFL